MVDIATRRLHNQQLEGRKSSTAAEAVTWLGAVQAQDYPGAKWALAMRLTPGATDADMDRAFAAGEILRTHVMRPTWHFVMPDDIRWLLALTAPRVNAVNAYMYRQLELDEPLLARSSDILGRALEGGKYLTRAELGAVLAAEGIPAEGPRLAYFVMRAELDAVIVSGPRRGRQFTYALLAERAPLARVLERDEALAELTRRYFTGHGPATERDFAWWSGLALSDVRAGLDMVASHLARETIDGKAYWSSPTTPLPEAPSRTAFLLPTYDEFLLGYADRQAAFDITRTPRPDTEGVSTFDSMVVIGGKILGSWRRTFKGGAAVVEMNRLAPLTAAESEALAVAQQRFSDFLDMPVIVS